MKNSKEACALARNAFEAAVNGLNTKALELLYNNEYTYNVMMEIYDVLKNDQDTINAEAC